VLRVLRSADNPSRSFGPFTVTRVAPPPLEEGVELAFGPLLGVHHATIAVGGMLSMHEHRNEEILSYVLRGSLLHAETSGETAAISRDRLMMMNAGTGFWHEESAPETEVEMLQIFILPEADDLDRGVQFAQRPDAEDGGGWRLVAGPAESGANLVVRQQVRVYDAALQAGSELVVPTASGTHPLLYVIDGSVEVGDLPLGSGDAVYSISEAELPLVRASGPATVVLFLVDLSAPVCETGTAWERMRAPAQGPDDQRHRDLIKTMPSGGE